MKPSPEKVRRLKKKYMSGTHFKGPAGTGERFKNCVAYFRERGDVANPRGLCGKIARRKGY